jgi:adenylate kinase
MDDVSRNATPLPSEPPAQRYKAILLFGPPGSGKGTQGKILATIPGFFHSATGDIFRSLDLQSHAGRVFWEYASHGELVPDEFTIDVWRQFIRGMEMINQFHPETEMLILDGVPRSVRQAKLLEDTIEVIKIIHLKADFEKMVERLKRRAFKENRVDDAKDDVIRRRMVVYEEQTRPLLDHYDDNLVAELDATQSQIRVLQQIVKLLVPFKEKLDEEAADLLMPATPRAVPDGEPVASA